jgi:cytoskeletal protein RodZ
VAGAERDGPGEEKLRAFGRWLVMARELRALSREEVAARTRLPPGVVEALESGEAARMPAAAYVMGTLRAYAGALGLDADEVVLRWQEATGGAAPEVRTRRRPPLVPLLVAGALALLAAAAIAAALLR